METKREKFLMWTEVEIIINSATPLAPLWRGEKRILKDIEDSFDIFSSMEKEFSRFDKGSDLSQLNILKTLKVSKRFIEILKLSKKMYQKTHWYFNPLINISNIWYSNNFKDNNFEKVDWEQNLDLEQLIVSNSLSAEGFSPLNLKNSQNLDFGWIVKWYTVDVVKEFLTRKWYTDFLINAGWDMYISKKSTIAIDSPENNGDIFALLDLENVSFSTSGTYKKKWKINWEEFHHILTPQENKNNNEIISISLITWQSYIWDAYATACIAMWLEKSLEFLRKEKIDWVIIWTDEKIYRIWDLQQYNFEII